MTWMRPENAMEGLRMLPGAERKLRAVGERGHLFASQSFAELLGGRLGAALCGRGTNRPEAERSTEAAVAADKGD